ncbi:MAG: disulfide bond formation protein B [Pseudomonadota bacterium]
MTIQSKHIHLAIGLGSSAVLAVALMYFQESLGLLPCPLCVLQRIAYLLIAVTALAAVTHKPRRRRPAVYESLLLVWSAAGIALASWQVWLSYHPAVAACRLSVEEKLLNALPLARWWPAMFEARGDCVAVEWSLFQLSMADLSLIAFVLIAALSILGAKRKRRESARLMFS